MSNNYLLEGFSAYFKHEGQEFEYPLSSEQDEIAIPAELVQAMFKEMNADIKIHRIEDVESARLVGEVLYLHLNDAAPDDLVTVELQWIAFPEEVLFEQIENRCIPWCVIERLLNSERIGLALTFHSREDGGVSRDLARMLGEFHFNVATTLNAPDKDPSKS